MAEIRKSLALLLCAGVLAMPATARADDDDDDRGDRYLQDEPDHAHARREVRRGGMVPLERILADAERRFGGRAIDVELDDGEYQIEVLLRDGRVAELVYDARSGRLLDEEVDDD